MAEAKPGQKLTAEQKAARDRRFYLKVRLPAVRGELKDLRAENSDLAQKLRDSTAAGKPASEARDMRQRRIYVMERLKAVKDELAALQSESKELAAKSKA